MGGAGSRLSLTDVVVADFQGDGILVYKGASATMLNGSVENGPGRGQPTWGIQVTGKG